MTTVTRKIGNCQICARDQKLKPFVGFESLVNHGFRRPGYGHIVGNCPGVKQLPYEVSCEAIKRYKADVAEYLAGKKVYLERLETFEIRHFTEYTTWSKTALDYAVGVTERYQWERAWERRVNDTKREISQLEFEIARCEQRIAEWVLKPIRTVEEVPQAERVKSSRRRRFRF